MMRSRTTTTRKTTTGRRGVLVGAVQWESLEGAGERVLRDAAERLKVMSFCGVHGNHAFGAGYMWLCPSNM